MNVIYFLSQTSMLDVERKTKKARVPTPRNTTKRNESSLSTCGFHEYGFPSMGYL